MHICHPGKKGGGGHFLQWEGTGKGWPKYTNEVPSDIH